MPLTFEILCDLLQGLEDNALDIKKRVPGWLDKQNKELITRWVKSNHVTVDSASVDVVTVLSAIFPEKRTDRVYSLQAAKLSRLLRRILGLGDGRWQQLDHYKVPGHGDLGACVERLQKQAEMPFSSNPITLDEVDKVLNDIAASNRHSGPEVRAAARDDDLKMSSLLTSVYRRLQSREAKWFTRMVLKHYSTLDFKPMVVFNAIDSRLSDALKVHDTFRSAVDLLRRFNFPDNSSTGLEASHILSPSRPPVISTAAHGQLHPSRLPRPVVFEPVVGSKVGRAPYFKGRSIKNVVSLAAGRRMSVERKYDGEYCQVHIDLSQKDKCIQLFSKSGKDSTVDRKGLHSAIRQGLRIGQAGCKFSHKCILEGEMVVYSDKEKCIMDFHKIRKHCSRSGIFLGTALDSQ